MFLAPTRRSDRVLVVAFVAADLLLVPLLVVLSFRIGALAADSATAQDTCRNWTSSVVPAVAIWVIVSGLGGCYHAMRSRPLSTDFWLAVKTVSLVTLIGIAVSVICGLDHPLWPFLAFALLAVPTVSAARASARWISDRIAPRRQHPTGLVVGTGPLAELATRQHVLHKSRGCVGGTLKIVGVVTLDDRADHLLDTTGYPVLGDLDHIHEVIEEHAIHEVIFATSELSIPDILGIIAAHPNKKVFFRVATDVFERTRAGADPLDCINLPIIDFGPGGLSLTQSILKRAFDLVLAASLIVVTAPLMLLITLILTLIQSGSPLFWHKRVGLHGKEFTLVKFRTMKPQSEVYEVAPVYATDNRVTGFGRLLRRTSLDELPQLFNVLAGSMSIVGPRPEMPFIVEQYAPWQRLRLNVKPGLTGLWQIMGRKELPLHENIEFDFYYVCNQSLMLDAAILLKTPMLVILGHGAY